MKLAGNKLVQKRAVLYSEFCAVAIGQGVADVAKADASCTHTRC